MYYIILWTFENGTKAKSEIFKTKKERNAYYQQIKKETPSIICCAKDLTAQELTNFIWSNDTLDPQFH